MIGPWRGLDGLDVHAHDLAVEVFQIEVDADPRCFPLLTDEGDPAAVHHLQHRPHRAEFRFQAVVVDAQPIRVPLIRSECARQSFQLAAELFDEFRIRVERLGATCDRAGDIDLDVIAGRFIAGAAPAVEQPVAWGTK
ncbi:hypothetical protein [Streptomyces goshikiensis]|uniref:hypothetical protein n=1 Tax=Streptomyces goshikiensis TaxID=1942 RepID=UPI0033CE04DE